MLLSKQAICTEFKLYFESDSNKNISSSKTLLTIQNMKAALYRVVLRTNPLNLYNKYNKKTIKET